MLAKTNNPELIKASVSCLVVSRANYRFVEGADRRLLVRNPASLHLCENVTTIVEKGATGLLSKVKTLCERCWPLNTKLTPLFPLKRTEFHCKTFYHRYYCVKNTPQHVISPSQDTHMHTHLKPLVFGSKHGVNPNRVAMSGKKPSNTVNLFCFSAITCVVISNKEFIYHYRPK